MVTPDAGCRMVGRFCPILFKDMPVCYHFWALTNTNKTLTISNCNLKMISGSKLTVAERMKYFEWWVPLRLWQPERGQFVKGEITDCELLPDWCLILLSLKKVLPWGSDDERWWLLAINSWYHKNIWVHCHGVNNGSKTSPIYVLQLHKVHFPAAQLVQELFGCRELC